MDESYVFFNGKIVPEKEVSISIRSKVVNYGLACFEGIRAYWDEEGQQLYGFRTTVYIRPLAYKGGEGLNPTLLDDDNRLLIYCQPLGNFSGKQEMRVAFTSWQRLRDNMLPPRTKASAAYLNSALASLEVLRNGFDEALFLTDNGNVCEGPGENIFMVKKGKLVTPPPSDNILEGITRETIITLAKEEFGMEVVERSIPRNELFSAQEVFFSGTAMEVMPIVEVDRRTIGAGRPGDICTKLKSLFFEITVGKNPKYAGFCTPVY